MVKIELYQLYRDLGIGVASIIVIISFAKWISVKAFEQIEKTNQALQSNNTKFMEFAEQSINKNTEALSSLASSMNKHIKSKDEALEMLKEKDKTDCINKKRDRADSVI